MSDQITQTTWHRPVNRHGWASRTQAIIWFVDETGTHTSRQLAVDCFIPMRHDTDETRGHTEQDGQRAIQERIADYREQYGLCYVQDEAPVGWWPNVEVSA